MPTAPVTVAETVFDSGRPDSVDTAPAASVIDTSSFDDGRTVIFQRRFSPFTVNALSRSVL